MRQFVRQLVYTMYIIDNGASFYLWWKENLVKHQKVSKYYENDCSFCYIEIIRFHFLLTFSVCIVCICSYSRDVYVNMHSDNLRFHWIRFSTEIRHLAIISIKISVFENILLSVLGKFPPGIFPPISLIVFLHYFFT